MIRVISSIISFLAVALFVGAAFAQPDVTKADAAKAEPRRTFATLLAETQQTDGGQAPQAGTEMTLQAGPPQLKGEATVAGDVIRAGDIWDNAGNKAQTPIARPPLPGSHITLDARWLAAMASNTGIDWKPSSNYDRIVVSRAGQSIDIGTVETELREALAMEGLPKTAQFEITNRQSLAIVIPADAQPTLAIRDVVIDPRTQRFSAVAEAPAGSPTATRVKISGRTFVTTRIPTLAHAMSRGEIINERDIVWTEVRDDAMRQDGVTDARQIIGMEPRNLLKAGQPVRMAELQRPVLVARNSLVTLVLQTPYMTLTSQGRAVEDGGMDDQIKVTNLQTKQVVEGKVQGSGTVIVAAVPTARPIASAY
jgi:flagella basal body P-ring formation protein FlgA